MGVRCLLYTGLFVSIASELEVLLWALFIDAIDHDAYASDIVATVGGLASAASLGEMTSM